MVVPEGHDENHSLIEGLAHDVEAAKALEGVVVAEGGLLGIAELVGDRVVVGQAGDVRPRVGDDPAVLDVEAANLGECARGLVVAREELGDDGELLRRIDGLADAEERLVAHAPRVEIAAVLVADTTVTVVAVTALSAGAAGLTLHGADVGRHSSALRVGLPDIHLVTTGAVLARARVRVVLGRLPVEDIGLVEEG